MKGSLRRLMIVGGFVSIPWTATTTKALTPLTQTLKVSYEGQTHEIPIGPEETILEALENIQSIDANMPSDCRRGNCLTCSARVVRDDHSHLQRGEDGLSPYISEFIEQKGYVLTCSSYVKGEGVQLELMANNNIWKKVYQQRLQQPEMQVIARNAMAQTVREHAERHVPEWTQETEEVYRKSGAIE